MRLNENVAVQFCLAHFIRDVKFLVEHPKRANRRYGKLLLGHLRKLFGVIHRRDQFASEASFRKTLTTIRNALVGDAIVRLPNTREAANLADRFVDHYDSYFRFITEPAIDPTNNLAEQAIRFVAIHRRLTQGTRGERGQRWCERMWTVLATCGSTRSLGVRVSGRGRRGILSRRRAAVVVAGHVVAANSPVIIGVSRAGPIRPPILGRFSAIGLLPGSNFGFFRGG